MAESIKIKENTDNNPMLSNAQAILHQPGKFILDFRSIIPHFASNNMPYTVTNHRVIILDPFKAKEFFDLLRKNIQKYEKMYGIIKKPIELTKAEKLFEEKKKKTKETKTKETIPSKKSSYMG